MQIATSGDITLIQFPTNTVNYTVNTCDGPKADESDATTTHPNKLSGYTDATEV
ncbi:hypothetical protein DAPPUDRAFT_235658 [Daphnia pulex]|uniref:Uncharacterized protein n=1 Tax=Daphnia pulex TaxID=6669 RepID=E9G0G4_DAPPU|nr:hypothetical protein DAPPUDRAFT_235658 [Daphnia pulex]|eukprot:EFX87409.1 hypothetical protein DAPPUDRAFT_235658 [Daphnia pulex]